jgi:tRNA modification GTPase
MALPDRYWQNTGMQSVSENQTIFALASAPGRAGVAVLRISGPQASLAIERLTTGGLPASRVASLRTLKNPTDQSIIDHALLLWFPAPASFTGEDVVELHLHGGKAIIQAAATTLQDLPDFRLAEPGEFTRRGFENGKFDLTAAEAIADLIAAETEIQRQQALQQLDGALATLYDGWRTRLTRALAHLEADIDFSDEDLPADIVAKRLADLRGLSDEIAAHLNDSHRGERRRDGFVIAILGAPNAGKSSLLNTLARRDAAIVSATAGTTRDVIEVQLDLGGYAVIVADTAGLRETSDAIENEGVHRALQRAATADLKLLLFDGAVWPQRDQATAALQDANSVVVISKNDLLAAPTSLPDVHYISTKTGAGIGALIKILTHEIASRLEDHGQPTLTRARHRAALDECHAALKRALSAAAPELQAEDVRLAVRALGRITGRVDVEDLLDVIFREFCIGK